VADHSAWLLLGSNIQPEENLRRAVDLLGRRIRLVRISSVWESPPADGSNQPNYLNAAVLAETDLSPEDLHAQVIAPIEESLGRRRSADKFSARTIDIDLALFDDRKTAYSGKELPHPDVLRHAYFAFPLAEISPEKPHPVTGEPLRSIAERMRPADIRRREDISLRPNPKPAPQPPARP
jgi:2-amino-4-hydroxy-6-hydroxymethyldihydropteridine diphosphokinase